MKNLIIILLLSFIIKNSFSQTKLDSIAFKAIGVTHYIKDKKYVSESDAIFYISKNRLLSSNNDQTQILNFLEIPKKDKNGWSVQCKDNGGFKCALFIGYLPKSDNYYVYIAYNNLEMIYQCKISNDKPYNDDPSNILILENPSDTTTYAGEIKIWNFKE